MPPRCDVSNFVLTFCWILRLESYQTTSPDAPSQPQSWPENRSKQASQPPKQPSGRQAVGGCRQVIEKPSAVDQASPPAGQPWLGGWPAPGWLDGRLVERPCWAGGQLAGRVPGWLASWRRNWIQNLDQEIRSSFERSNFPKWTIQFPMKFPDPIV